MNTGNKRTICTLHNNVQKRQSTIVLRFHRELQRWVKVTELGVKNRSVVDRIEVGQYVIKVSLIHMGLTAFFKRKDLIETHKNVSQNQTQGTYRRDPINLGIVNIIKSELTLPSFAKCIDSKNRVSGINAGIR